MTHTPGLEETFKDLFVPDEKWLMPLGTYLRSHLPRQIYEPGTTPAYSNYATALAAYVVERVSGEPFEQYAEKHVFGPLGMTRSTFRQPLPAAIAPLMSSGYALGSGAAKRFEVVAAYPAGSCSVTALDITRFMLAHLADGAGILKPETARLMHARQFGLNEHLNGMALGFYEESRNGLRIIGHGGDTVYFHSDLHLAPAERLGFFVSYNSAGKGEISPRAVLWEKFLDRYYPARGQRAALDTARRDAEAVAGYYLSSRRPETNIFAIVNPFSQMKVRANEDGTISMGGSRLPGGALRRFREVGPMVFEEVAGQTRWAFQKDRGGRWLAIPSFPVFVFQRTAGVGGQLFNTIGGVLALGVIIAVLALWPVAWAVRWHFGRALERPPAGVLRIVSRIGCAGFGLALLVFLYVGSLADEAGTINHGIDWMLRLAQFFALCGVVGALAAVVNAVRMVASRVWWWVKVQECAVAVACVFMSWFFVYWHILTLSLRG